MQGIERHRERRQGSGSQQRARRVAREVRRAPAQGRQRGAAEIWRTFGGDETPDQRKLRVKAEKQAAKAEKLSPRQKAAAIRKRDAATYAKSASKRAKAFAS